MNIKYVRHPSPVGFGNDLYFALQAYINSTPEEKIIECRPLIEKDRGIFNTISAFNLDSFFTLESKKSEFIDEWEQYYGKDFTQQQLESFIKQYLLKSNKFANYEVTEDKEKCVLLNIRNGDYIHDRGLNCFNRMDYILQTINHPLIKDFDEVHIFSDDLNLCKREYHKVLANRFKEIKYITKGSIPDDLVEISYYKNKIIWNSTFSFWGSFIGSVIYDHTGVILCPDQFNDTEKLQTRGAPYWTYIKVSPRYINSI